MKHLADLLFEARILKVIPRSGFSFLGVGKESVAEHVYMTTFIAFIMGRMVNGIDSEKLISMCLIHDMCETRTGDLNYVQKIYVTAHEKKARQDMLQKLPFGNAMDDLMAEFNEGRTVEAQLAQDADQLSLVIELKHLSDMGYKPPEKWMPHVIRRIRTPTGKKLADAVINREQDAWWLDSYRENRPDDEDG